MKDAHHVELMLLPMLFKDGFVANQWMSDDKDKLRSTVMIFDEAILDAAEGCVPGKRDKLIRRAYRTRISLLEIDPSPPALALGAYFLTQHLTELGLISIGESSAFWRGITEVTPFIEPILEDDKVVTEAGSFQHNALIFLQSQGLFM